MNTPILNRDTGKMPIDGWHQIEVPGEHVNHESQVVQVIDRAAIDSIINRFAADAAMPNFSGILIDKDHFSLDAEKPTEAMGWAIELRNRDGIPEARIDWTSAGRPLVEGKTYKFFSTVYNPADVEMLGLRIVNGAKYKVVRPLHLARLALTNDPNNKGGRPISNRNGAPADAGNNQPEPNMKTVNKELGLAEDAPEASSLAEIQKIKNRATSAETERDALKKERDELLTAQVEADLEKHKDVIANRDAMKAQLIANRKATLAVLEGLKKPEPKKPATQITNRAGATPPAAADEGEGLYAKRDAAVRNYAIKNRCDFEAAWNAVRSEQPDLFKEEQA